MCLFDAEKSASIHSFRSCNYRRGSVSCFLPALIFLGIFSLFFYPECIRAFSPRKKGGLLERFIAIKCVQNFNDFTNQKSAMNQNTRVAINQFVSPPVSGKMICDATTIQWLRPSLQVTPLIKFLRIIAATKLLYQPIMEVFPPPKLLPFSPDNPKCLGS